MGISRGLLLFLLSCNLGEVATSTGAATTTTTTGHHHHHVHHTRPTREPAEGGSMYFQYDHFCHLLAFKDDAKSCYIYWVSPEERPLVHSESGFFQIQAQIVTMAINASVTYSRDDLSVRSSVLTTFCPSGYSLYKLN
ncbi:uncharacterized protein LOC111104764 [Crassostrea virginica]